MKTITSVIFRSIGVALLAACSASPGGQGLPSDSDDQITWQTYANATYQFTIELPTSWKVIEPPSVEYPTATDQVWFVSEALPQPQTDSRADVVLIFTQEDPSSVWGPQYFDDYQSDVFWLGDRQARKISGINKESRTPEMVVLGKIGDYYLQALPNHGENSLKYFDQVISSIRWVQEEATSPLPTATSIQRSLDEKTIAYEGIDITYPSWLAEESVGQTLPAYVDPSGFMYDDLPEHVRFDFSIPYTTQDPFVGLEPSGIPWLRHQNPEGPEIQPIIFIFPTAEYAELSPLAGERIEALELLLDDGNVLGNGETPVLPTFNSAQDLHGQVKPLEFQGGRGLRFVTRYSQGVAPVVNPSVFYTFQGLTNDGSLYIAAFFPLHVSILPDQIQVKDWDAFNQGYIEYLADITSRLDELEPDIFEPDLLSLDALIRTLSVDAISFPR
jgi:hypothetical protein